LVRKSCCKVSQDRYQYWKLDIGVRSIALNSGDYGYCDGIKNHHGRHLRDLVHSLN